MNMNLIDGKSLSQEVLSGIKKEVEKLPFIPVFCDVLVGEDKVSMQYVDMKSRKAESVGMLFHKPKFPASITTEQLVKEIQSLNNIENICGLILQLPLPSHIDNEMVLNAVDPNIDVDCLGKVASDKFYSGDNEIGFPTALSCMRLVDSVGMDLSKMKVTVLGYGNLVGKPVTALLHFRGLDPVIVRSQTENKEKIIAESDLIISGIGKGKYLTGDMIKKGAVLVDAGTSESDSGVVGDVDLDSVSEVAGYVSPVPGGVGPMTVAMLLQNVLAVAKKRALNMR